MECCTLGFLDRPFFFFPEEEEELPFPLLLDDFFAVGTFLAPEVFGGFDEGLLGAFVEVVVVDVKVPPFCFLGGIGGRGLCVLDADV